MKKGYIKRQIRTRSKLLKTKPRLTVYKSNKYISAQIIDDSKNITLAQVAGKKSIDSAKKIGFDIAKKAGLKKIKTVVFDRGGYRYHGKVKAVAEGAREGGLKI